MVRTLAKGSSEDRETTREEAKPGQGRVRWEASLLEEARPMMRHERPSQESGEGGASQAKPIAGAPARVRTF